MQLESRYWYRQIVWGRFDRGGVGWMFSKPVISREFWLGPLGLPSAELMLPEYLKGKLSIDEWRTLIAMHMVRLKFYNSGRMSLKLGLWILALGAAFVPILLLFDIFVPRPWGPILVFPAWSSLVPIFFSGKEDPIEGGSSNWTEKWPLSSVPSEYRKFSGRCRVSILGQHHQRTS